MMIHMYFAVMWLEPRLVINETAVEWDEDRTGPKDEVNESPETLKYLWYPELEIYGLETFGRQRVLKEMPRVRKTGAVRVLFYVCQGNTDKIAP